TCWAAREAAEKIIATTDLIQKKCLVLPAGSETIIRANRRLELRMRVVWVRLAAALTLVLLAVIAVADDLGGPVSFVPWKVLVPGDTPASAPLSVFWVPASPDDFKHSEMLFSRPLTSFASQCV